MSQAEASRSNPRHLRQLAGQVREFERAFTTLLDLCHFTAKLRAIAGPDLPDDVAASYASLPAVIVDPAVPDDKWVAAKARCSLAAGRIAHVPDISGVRVARRTGGSPVNPFEQWVTVTQSNSVVLPDDILGACEHTIGALEALADQAEAATPANIATEAMHPLVWQAARELWLGEHYREAVVAAADALIQWVKQLTGRHDLDDTNVMKQAFSSGDPEPGKPRLRWPGDPQDQTVRSMNDGLRSFAIGVQLAIRNVVVHDRSALTAQEAGERLAALSLAARWIDRCRVIDVGDQ